MSVKSAIIRRLNFIIINLIASDTNAHPQRPFAIYTHSWRSGRLVRQSMIALFCVNFYVFHSDLFRWIIV
jgi:hypothetical protein